MNNPFAAAELVANSPLELEYHRPENADGLGPAIPLPSTAAKPTGRTGDTKNFRILAFEARHPHATLIAEHPLYGPWPDERTPYLKANFRHDTFALNTLQIVVPRDMASKGLRDWETGTDFIPTPPPSNIKDFVNRRRNKRALQENKKAGRVRDALPLPISKSMAAKALLHRKPKATSRPSRHSRARRSIRTLKNMDNSQAQVRRVVAEKPMKYTRTARADRRRRVWSR